jgi:hypothetical protein
MFLSDFRAHPDQIDKFTFLNPGVFGVKGGVMASDTLQIEGNFGYLNQFKLSHPTFDPKTHAIQYEGGINWALSRSKTFPYLAVAVGAMTLNISNSENLENPESITYLAIVPPFQNGGPIPFTSRPLTMEDGDTFLTFSYGGGVNIGRVWGPMGFRFDLRGRTMPNFYGDTVWAIEPSGGITFSWGER